MLNYQTRNDLPSNAKAVSIAVLNARLADAVDLALLTKQAHWNIKGPNFIALHEMIDGFRSELDTHVDTMAERVVQLGGTAQGAEQQSRKFAPADASTRTANEAFQICRPGAAVPFSPRSDQQPFPPPPRSRHCCRAQSFQNPEISGLGRNLQHGLPMKFLMNIASRLPPVTSTQTSCRTIRRRDRGNVYQLNPHFVLANISKKQWQCFASLQSWCQNWDRQWNLRPAASATRGALPRGR